jgi:hypothetical protein
MMQFLGIPNAVDGIGAEVNVAGCPAENEIHPFEPM